MLEAVGSAITADFMLEAAAISMIQSSCSGHSAAIEAQFAVTIAAKWQCWDCLKPLWPEHTGCGWLGAER